MTRLLTLALPPPRRAARTRAAASSCSRSRRSRCTTGAARRASSSTSSRATRCSTRPTCAASASRASTAPRSSGRSSGSACRGTTAPTRGARARLTPSAPSASSSNLGADLRRARNAPTPTDRSTRRDACSFGPPVGLGCAADCVARSSGFGGGVHCLHRSSLPSSRDCFIFFGERIYVYLLCLEVERACHTHDARDTHVLWGKFYLCILGAPARPGAAAGGGDLASGSAFSGARGRGRRRRFNGTETTVVVFQTRCRCDIFRYVSRESRARQPDYPHGQHA